MKKRTIPAALLSVCISVTGITSCSSKDKARVISKDSPWFNVTTVDFEMPDPPKKDHYTSALDPFYRDGGYDALIEYEDIGDYGSIGYAVRYNDSGKIVDSVNVSEKLNKTFSTDLSDYEIQYGEIFGNSSNSYSLIYIEKEESYEKPKYALLDLSTGECKDYNFLGELAGNGIVEYQTVLDSGKAIYLVEDYTADISSEIITMVIVENDKIVQKLSLSEVLGEESFRMTGMDSYKNEILFYGGLQGENKEINFRYDLETGKLTRKELTSAAFQLSIYDGKEFTVTPEGVFDISGEKSDTEPVVDFDYCNVRRDLCSGLLVISNDENGCTLAGETYNDNDEVIIRKYCFEKASENPNAGKKILTVGIIGYVLRMHYMSVYDFNNSSNEYFIEMKEYFSKEEEFALSSVNNGIYGTDEAVANDVENKSVDILSGEAPDVLFDAHSYIQLKDPDILTDMSSIVKDISKDQAIFENVISASRSGDELYFIPLAFSIEGIVADKSLAGDKTGFTFPEYEEFVYGPCNGNDPVAKLSTRLQFFSTIFGTMSDLFYDKDGNIDLQNEAFYELAEYCRKNVPEEPYLGDIMNGMEPQGPNITDMRNIEDYDRLLCVSKSKEFSLYGLPSYDGRGPLADVKTSVSITSTSVNKKGAEEYVRYLLTPSIQKATSECYYSNPLLKDVCIERCKDLITYHNNSPYSDKKMSEDQIDGYIALIETAKNSDNTDPAVMIIVSEEIQAYFKDQKSI